MSRRRTERLVNLVLCLLSTRRFLTAGQVARIVPGYEHDEHDPRAHEAFQRMFERDKAELRELGVPLETGTTSAFDTEPGYRIARRDYALPEVHLAPEEAAAVGLAAQLWHQAGLASAASSGLLKLRAGGVEVEPPPTLGIEPVVGAEPALEPMLAAIHARRAVRFGYRTPHEDQPRVRRLHPWGAVSWRGRWYVVGHDLDRAATRCFRLSRVTGAAVPFGPAGAFTPPDGVDLLGQVAAFEGAPGRPGVARVRLRSDAGAGLRRWADTVSPDADGWDLLTLSFHDPEALAGRLAGYGSAVVVLEPPEVRAAVIHRLARIAGEVEPAAAAVPAGVPVGDPEVTG
ncbi:MAG TPA: WYL domain-containing protein [Cryptosporangiaceae bacterium]|nr:WYL domain-containing protein [Cryptosporangiaceae bacterium]